MNQEQYGNAREPLAAYAHEAWAGWMRYLFRFGQQHDDGTFTIDADKVARWRRQMTTEYAALPEDEKASDRNEADQIIGVFAFALTRPTCARCGAPLNNVAPGFSVVQGSATVCANCMRPGEEVARAKNIA